MARWTGGECSSWSITPANCNYHYYYLISRHYFRTAQRSPFDQGPLKLIRPLFFLSTLKCSALSGSRHRVNDGREGTNINVIVCFRGDT